MTTTDERLTEIIADMERLLGIERAPGYRDIRDMACAILELRIAVAPMLAHDVVRLERRVAALEAARPSAEEIARAVLDAPVVVPMPAAIDVAADDDGVMISPEVRAIVFEQCELARRLKETLARADSVWNAQRTPEERKAMRRALREVQKAARCEDCG